MTFKHLQLFLLSVWKSPIAVYRKMQFWFSRIIAHVFSDRWIKCGAAWDACYFFICIVLLLGLNLYWAHPKIQHLYTLENKKKGNFAILNTICKSIERPVKGPHIYKSCRFAPAVRRNGYRSGERKHYCHFRSTYCMSSSSLSANKKQ